MRLFLDLLARINRALEKLLHWVLLALLFGFIALIIYQIVSRNLPLLPRLYWTEEFSRFAFQWMIMLGTAIGVLHADHFVLEAFPRGSRADRLTRWIRDLACLAVGTIFVVHGQEFALSGLRRSATASGMSMIFVYATFMVCGVFIMLFAIERLVRAALDGLDSMEAAMNTPDPVQESIDAQQGHQVTLETPSQDASDGRPS
ncbi:MULTISPECIES: TRAP transporter small permease [Halomonas]|uniref:TRAP transporter small permease n=1 Tax=Halomonas TaxID=2745 RepID=UPI001A904FD1|nr:MULTISPECIES: TRAP transporter small permease subunit [Halomonas]MED5297052.1 TRAP transporter small permease subunit [Pseudomonadota bacterium]MBN8413054.1 TRAP transporter small permease subunit [Halomonas litopenaei]MBY5925350.1 TRAP transporter small permease subunit [Halomonas sp. DP4Y7-2]MBY6031449.1 TRAP transporter small permease subunit [Halomonas sp. DP8Y7-1]MBY6232391.1 TRAP transporter small permease subunit [Halomonas sp. DP4Y7-1]